MDSPRDKLRNVVNKKLILLLSILLTAGVYAHGATRVRILGNSVNLRAGPSLRKEVVSQVSDRDQLTVIGPLEGEWIEVAPPPTADMWVYDEFVSNGVVVVSRLLVRAGPGMNYSILGRLEKGAKVVERGSKGVWRKIAPPSSCHLWLSREYVERVSRPTSVRKPELPVAGTPPRPKQGLPELKNPAQEKRTVKTVPVTLRSKQTIPPQSGIDEKELVAGVEQGKIVQYKGTLYKASMAWRRPSKYRLMAQEGRGRLQTVCYILGEGVDLESFSRKSVLVTGSEYWVQGLKHPVVVTRELILCK